MKKLVCFLLTTVLLAACGGRTNLSGVSQQAATYNQDKNYLVAGQGDSPQAASQQALEAMRQELVQNAPLLEKDPLLTKLMALAVVQKTWPDPYNPDNGFHALAVLPRANAVELLTPLIDQTDTELAEAAAQLPAQSDALAQARASAVMQPLAARREMLDGTYQFLSAAHEPYLPERFEPYLHWLQNKRGHIQVGLKLESPEQEILDQQTEQVLSALGVTLWQADGSEPDLTVEITAEPDGCVPGHAPQQVLCSAHAAIHAVDNVRGVSIARFSSYERANGTDQTTATRQSLQAVAEQAASQLAARLESYLQTHN